jgi:hypothetical protein
MFLSSEEFARAYRQNSAEEWSPIPAVITRYNESTQEAVVKPLQKQIFKDNSTHELNRIYGVPIWTPRTAFAGLQLPVKVGDKVLLLFTMRSIDTLLESDLSGYTIKDQVSPKDNRFKQYEFCIGLAGFHDTKSAIGTDQDVRLLNNWKSHENELRLTEDGSVNIKNPTTNLRMDISGEIKADNENSSITLAPDGNVTITNDSVTVEMTPDGVLNLTAPGSINIDTPTSNFTGEIIAQGEVTSLFGGVVKLTEHTHIGVTPGPSNTGPPDK